MAALARASALRSRFLAFALYVDLSRRLQLLPCSSLPGERWSRQLKPAGHPSLSTMLLAAAVQPQPVLPALTGF